MPLSTEQDSELDSLLGTAVKVAPRQKLGAPPLPRPLAPKPSVDDELDGILSGAPRALPPEPGAFDTLKGLTPPGEAFANLKNLPKFVTEGIPKASKTFWDTATSPEPTMGQELAKAAPWLPIIPAVQDIISRTGRGLSGLTKGVAELGPEQAKPLTEVLANVALGGRGALEAGAGMPAGSLEGVGAGALRRPPAPPSRAPMPPPDQLALPPRPERPMLPSREGLPALPETTSGMIPQGPPVQTPIPQGPIFKRSPTEADRLAAAREAGFGPRGARPELPPRDIAGPALTGDLLDAQGRPIQTPDVGPSPVREKQRAFYKGRGGARPDLTGPTDTGRPFGEPEPWTSASVAPTEPPGTPGWFDPTNLPPKPSPPVVAPPPPAQLPPAASVRPQIPPQNIENVFGIEMDKPGARMPPPAAAPTPNPELALRDYMAPGGTKVVQKIGDELVTWTKTDRNEWQGWVAGQHRKLTGESALNLAANPPAPMGAPPARPPSALGAPPASAPPAEMLPVNPRALPVKPPTVGPAAPPRFEATPEGMQGVIGGTPAPEMPTRALKAQVPQQAETSSPLFGQGRTEGVQSRLEMGGRQQANVNEWVMDQLGGTYGIALTRAKSPEAIQPAVVAKLKSLGIDPKDAWQATHAEVPPAGVLDRLAELSVPKPALEATPPKPGTAEAQGFKIGGFINDRPTPPKPLEMTKTFKDPFGGVSPQARRDAAAAKMDAAIARLNEEFGGVAPQGNIRVDPEWRAARAEMTRAEADIKKAAPPKPRTADVKMSSTPLHRPFQAKGDWETGVPNLADPNDVFAVIQGAGKIKVGEDLAGELRGVPALFKSKNGQPLDRIAEGLIENYPHLGGGDRAAVKDQLIDTMTRYASLRRDKATAAAKQGREFDVGASVPLKPATGSLAPEDTILKQAMDFFADLGTDESGALNLGNFGKAWKKQREKLPMETAVIRDNPRSPVISAVERATSRLADWTQDRVNMPWSKAVRKADPEAMKDAEVQAIAEWTANGKTPQAELAARHHFPAEVQAAMKQRDVLFDQANRSRAYFGLEPIPRTPGPYLPRVVEEGRDAVSLRGEGVGGGQSLRSTTPGGHREQRAYETYRAGEAEGLEYEDPRNAILLRDWNDLKIRATHSLFKELEDRGVLFRDEAGAAKVSPTGRPWKVDDAPGNTGWWTPTESEAKFLKQNLKEQGGGSLSSLVHYANATLRNPNLNNPFPHVVKNMAYKELLAQGPVSMARVARDAVELHRGTNPTMIAEFNEAMPFAKSAQTAGESLNRGLIRPTVAGKVAQKGIEAAGMLNAPSKKVIFEWADPAMRYSLWKHYRAQGMDKFEAANHAWVDLIRYGTRSDRTDFWKSMPLNFFVPWRFGTLVSLVKQAKNHPVRTAMTIGAVEYIREAIHRQTGYWFHLPTDYAQKPLAAMAQSESPGEAGRNLASTALTTAFLGPGGDFPAKQIGEAMKLIGGDPNSFEWDRLRNAFWGISQLWNMQDEFKRGDYGGMLGTALVGAHRAYTYEPRRLTRDLPEWLPGMQKSAGVREAEEMRQTKKEKFERAQERRSERGKPPTIEDRLRAGGYIR